MVRDDLTIAQRADQEFLANARKRSPKYPSIVEALERRRRERETIAARSMLFFVAMFMLASPFVEQPSAALLGALVCFISFLVICWAAGSRAWRNNGGG